LARGDGNGRCEVGPVSLRFARGQAVSKPVYPPTGDSNQKKMSSGAEAVRLFEGLPGLTESLESGREGRDSIGA